MARKKVSDLMKGGLREFKSGMPRHKNGFGRFNGEDSIPEPVETPSGIDLNGSGHEATNGVHSLPLGDPMLWENPSFRDKAFLEEYVAILEKNRAADLVIGDEEG